jgi:hypothetical protein
VSDLFAEATRTAIEAARTCIRQFGPDAALLYQRWFHEETGQVAGWPSRSAYHAAILDPRRFERGWMVVAPVAGLAGGVMVQRGGRQRVVAPPEMLPENPHALAPGRGHTLRVDPVASGEADGFWHAWSAAWQVRPPERYVRLYCRVSPARAPAWAARLVRVLPRRSAWAFKLLCGRHEAGRRDTALLYVPARTPLASGWLADAVAEAARLAEPGAPAPFLIPVETGVAWAPDPADGRSFGQALCDCVIAAAVHADDPAAFAAAVDAGVRALPGMAAGPACLERNR